jgi:hypothetical protein
MAYRNGHFRTRSGATRANYDERSSDLFARRDRNKDGILSASELTQLPPKRS